MSYDNSLRSYPVNFSLLHASSKNPPHNNHPLLLTKMSLNEAEERSTRDEDEDFIESELKRNEKELENTLSLLKELEMSDGLPLSLLGNSAHQVNAPINRNELRLNLHDIYDRSNLKNSVSRIQDGGQSSSLFFPSPHSDISQNGMGNSSVNSLIQSIQEQIRATQQLTLQNEQENVMINQQLSSLMQRRQSTYESYGSTAIKATDGTVTRGSVEDEELVHMRLQHQKELEKLKFEQEKIQQERELEELKLSREKQRIEQKKIEEQQELDTWKQKMKTRREKAQTSGFLGFNQSSFSESDLSKQGFQIYFDFVTGLSPNIKAVSLVYAIYDCESMALKTPVRRAPVSETDIMLFNASEAEESNLERQSIFLVRRQYPRELLSIARPLKMILELLSVTNTSVPNDPLVVSLGWSVIEITNDQYFLNEGCFRLPLFAPHVDTSLKPNQLDQHYKRLQSALFVRIVSPANFRQMEAFPVSSETQSKYKVPDSFSVPKFVTGKGSSRASTPSEKKSILSRPVEPDETKTPTELILSVQSNPEISVDLKIDDPQTIEPIPLDAQPDTGETAVDFQRTGSVQSSPTDTLNSPTIIYDSSYGIGVQVQSCTNLPQTLGADKQFYVKVDLLYGSEAVERKHSQRYFSWETTSSNVEDSRAVTWEQQIVFSDFQYQKDANILLSLFMRAQDSGQKEESSNHGNCTENSSVLLYWKVLPLFKLKFERNEMIVNSGQFHLRLDEPPLDIQSVSSKQISNYDDLPIIDVFLSNSSDSKPLPELSPDIRTTINVQQRSGLVVCIDRAEHLPENVLFSRILVGYFSSNFDPLCGYEPILMQPDSCCLEPEYGYTRDFVWIRKRIRDQDTKDIDELRKSEFLSGTIIDDEFYVIIQMETVDPKMQKRDVGYAVLSLICDKTSEEDKDTEKIQYGQFKLPLHTMPFPCIEELRDGTYKNSPQLPCSSLMVRVCKMTTGGNGAILRRSSFPIKQWQALYGYKKGTIYEDTEPRHLANRKLQTTLKNKISASLRWKTARVVVDNLQQITKAKNKEISFLFDPMLVDKDHLGNLSTEMVAKRMKTLFLKNSAESSLLVTPFIDQIGCILIPECLFIEAKYFQPGVMYFLVVKVFLVKDEARNTSNPDYVQIHISEEVDWTESRMGLIVWRRKPILVSHATKNYPISNIVVEMTVQYYSNSKEMLQHVFPISSVVDTSKEAAIRRNTALSRDTTSKGIKKLAQIVLGNRNRMKHREAMETMTPEELRRSYQGKPMNTFLKPLTRSGRLSARKSNGLKTLGWTLFSALLPGKEIGANPYLFTKSGRFLSPLIPGSIPADVYPSLLADKFSVQSMIAKHETNEPVGAVYFECFDAQRQHEFDWLSKRIFEEGNYNYLSKLHKYMPINHANLAHYINLVDMCKHTDYEEFLHESLIDACEVSRDNLEKSQIVYAVRDQVLTQCYESLRSTLL